MHDNTKAALKRFAANAMTPEDTATLIRAGVPMGCLLDGAIQTILRKTSTGAMLSVEEIKSLVTKGVNVETFLGIKSNVPSAPAPVAPTAPVVVPTPPATPQNVTVVSSDPIERLDKKSRASFYAKARTRAIYALRDGLKARGAEISDDQHTDAAGFARAETGLTASVLATLSKNTSRPVNRTVGTEDAIKAYRNALADAGIVVSDDTFAAAQVEALASYEAFLAATRRIVTRALALV